MNKDKIHPLEILPVKRNKKEDKNKLPDPIPNFPFCLTLIAPTNSGKTVVIVNLLYRHYKKYFDEIIYISPTVHIDDTLENNVNEDDEITKIYEDDDLRNVDILLDEVIKEQKKTPKEERKKILIVLDDMIAYFKKHSTLDNLPSLSRHYGICFIVCSQSYMALPPRLRRNASHYIIFRVFNKEELASIYKEIGSNYEDFGKYYEEATKEKYSFLMLDNKKMELYKKFTHKLWEKYPDK
jgi:hypothetical protein